MITPRSARTTSTHSSSTTCTARASGLPRRSASASRPLARRDLGRARRRAPSALETALCAITSTVRSSSGSPASAAADGHERREVGAAGDLGQAGQGSGAQLGHRAGRVVTGAPSRGRAMILQPGARAHGPSRLDRSRRRRVAPAARRDRRRCRCRAAATRGGRCSSAPPPPAASAAWRARLSGPKLGAITSGGREQQRVRPRAVTVRDDHDLVLGPGAQQLLELARVERRAVAGDEQDALGAISARARHSGGRRRRSARSRARPRSRSRRPPAPWPAPRPRW